jgi:hypothetical protein
LKKPEPLTLNQRRVAATARRLMTTPWLKPKTPEQRADAERIIAEVDRMVEDFLAAGDNPTRH